jgi:hypothetical protein
MCSSEFIQDYNKYLLCFINSIIKHFLYFYLLNTFIYADIMI